MVHGWPDNSYLYHDISQELCGPRYTPCYCIAPTRVAFGRSSCPDDPLSIDPSYERDRVAEFLKAIEEELGVEEYVLVVHDWGGPTGVGGALRDLAPDGRLKMSHLILHDTFLHFGHIPLEQLVLRELADILQSLAGPISGPIFVDAVMQDFTFRHQPQSVLARFWVPYSGLPPAGGEGVCKQIAGVQLFGEAKTPASDLLYQEIKDGLEREPALGGFKGRPAFFIWAEEDRVEGSAGALGIAAHELMQTLLPQANTRILPRANHYIQLDQPEKSPPAYRPGAARDRS